MGSSNPPGTKPTQVKASVGTWRTNSAALAAAIRNPPPNVRSASAPAGNATAARLLAFMPEPLHLALAQELAGLFKPMVPMASTFPDAQSGLGSYGVAFVLDGAKSLMRPSLSRAALDAAVAQSAGLLEPRVVAEAQAQADDPMFWLLTAVGLDLVVDDGPGRATLVACDTALLVANLLVMNLKDLLQLERPDSGAWGSKWKPLITKPLHHSLPGGHALTLTTGNEVLLNLMGGQDAALRPALEGLADQISENRCRVGLHTRLDNDEGKAIGVWLAERLRDAESVHPRWAALCALARSEWSPNQP